MTVGDTLDAGVARLLRDVAHDVVMPRFGRLQHGDVAEKTPGELVTVADHEAELRLEEGLTAFLPEARIVGEEACAADPTLVDDVGEGLVWIVDPIDGTANFAAGHGPFGLMVALVADGDVLAGWIYDPLGDRLCRARRGGGATCDDTALRVSPRTRSRPIAALATQFMAPGDRAAIEARARDVFDLVPIPRCAAEHYPRVAFGANDVAMFQRSLPWDHAAGTLILTEAGGVATDWDGAPYRVGAPRHGLLVATNRTDWDLARRTLFADGQPPTYPG